MIGLMLFDMLQRRVRLIKPLIDGVESSIDMSPQIAEPRVVDEDSYKYSDRGNANGKGDLNSLIGHCFTRNTPFRTALPLFKMLQPRVDHFLDPTELGAPCIFRVVESSIHMTPEIAEPGIQIPNAGIEIAEPRVVDKNPHEYSDRGNAYGKGDLNCLIGHRCFHNTPF
jgi:hypothetical protein